MTTGAAEIPRDLLEWDPALDAALDAAYAEANREELRHLAVAGDEVLGGLVDELAYAGRVLARAEAARTRRIYDLAAYTAVSARVVTSDGMRAWDQKRTAARVAVSEIALALRIPERTAQNLIEEARTLVDELPATLRHLETGDFSYRHAQVIVNHANSLPAEARTEFEARVLPFAIALTVAGFEQKARTIRERMDPATIQKRHEKSLADREVWFEPARDGMAWLHLYTSATIALSAYNRADELAHAAQGGSEERTLTQLRTDAVTDLLLEGVVANRPEFAIRPSVTITVPALSMLGLKNANGEFELPILEGYGPMDIETATLLAGSAKSWLRVITHPETGATLSVGRHRRKVPASLRAFLRHVDGTCRKPGCNRAAIRCDIDHTQEWQHGGQTAHDNLAHLCAAHHAEKHHTGVTLQKRPNGDLAWTMPSGRTYVSVPGNCYAS